MAEKINMKSVNSTKIEELKTEEPIKTEETVTEEPINTQETAEDTNEVKAEEAKTETEEPIEEQDLEGKVIVQYVGNGVWQDSTGQYWARQKEGSIISEKVFSNEDYDKAEDVKFMVGYGEMKLTRF